MRMKITMLLCVMVIMNMVFGTSIAFSKEQPVVNYTVEFAKEVAQYYLNTVYSSEQSEKGLQYVCGESFVPVFDVDGKQKAYLISVIEKGTGQEIGYVMVGTTNEETVILEASVNDVVVNGFLATSTTNNKLVYLAPLILGYLVDGNESLQVYQNARDQKEIQVDTKKVRDQKEKNRVKDVEKNKKSWKQITAAIQKVSASYSNNLSASSTTLSTSIATQRLYEVTNEVSFCDILLGNTKYAYGGNQGWLDDDTTDSYLSENSCGVVAIANIAAYWAKNKTIYAKLYPYADLSSRTFSEINFLTHIKRIYDHMKPSATFGIPTLSYLNAGLVKYEKSVGSNLLKKVNINTGTYAKFVSSIKAGLSSKAPIVMLSYLEEDKFPNPSSFNVHWITITKYFKDTGTNTEYFVCSSWGKRYTLPLQDYYNTYECMEGAYFK